MAAYSDVTIADPEINGRIVPSLFERANAAVVPAILSGHAPQGNDQIVLGAATLKDLGTHVGGTVTVTYGSKRSAPYYVPPTVLHVVGSATMPAIGFPSSEGDHTSMGIGALLPTGVIPAAFRQALKSSSPDPTLDGPEFVFVQMRPGVSQAAARADIRRIALAGNRAFTRAPNGDGTGDTVLVASDLLPAEIVNYRSTGATPALLAGSLAVAAVIAARTYPRRIGASTAPGAGALEGARLHRKPGVRVRGRAGDHNRALRPPRRDTARHRARALAVGALRPRDLRRPAADRAHVRDRRCGRGSGRARQRRSCVSRAYGCQNTVGADTAGRVRQVA